MKTLKDFITITLLALSPLLLTKAQAESSKTFVFSGQESEQISLATDILQTYYRQEEIDTTCTEQIPYTEEECGYETDYRTECHTVPGHQECYQVERTRCHDEPVQECRKIPQQKCGPVHERECKNVPEYVCRDEPRRICEPTEVCEMAGRQRICHTETKCRIDTERVCGTINKQECHDTVVNRCETHYEQECHNTTRIVCESDYENECSWVADQEVCESIPYQEYRCHDVTKYDQREYACKKIIDIPEVKVVGQNRASIEFNFENLEAVSEIDNINISTTMIDKELNVKAKNTGVNKGLIFVKENVRREPDDGDWVISAKYNLSIVPLAIIDDFISAGIQDLTFDQTQINFFTNTLSVAGKYKLAIKLKRNKGIFSNMITLIDRELTDDEVSITNLSLIHI